MCIEHIQQCHRHIMQAWVIDLKIMRLFNEENLIDEYAKQRGGIKGLEDII